MKISRHQTQGFSLVELLVSISILAVIIVLLADMVVRTQNTMQHAAAHAGEFQEARSAMDAISNSLGQATLDAYWNYQRDSSSEPTGFERASDHHLVIDQAKTLINSTHDVGQALFFQAPLGYAGSYTESTDTSLAGLELERLRSLMNCWGFYIAYKSDLEIRPEFLKDTQSLLLTPERKRFRLMQYCQPAEESILYSKSLNLNNQRNLNSAKRWFLTDLEKHSRPVADNILALVLTPYSTNVTQISPTLGITETAVEPDENFSYDSRDFQWNGDNMLSVSRRHQLPAKVQITLISAEERSYDRYVGQKGGDDNAATAIQAILAGRFTKLSDYEKDVQEVSEQLHVEGLHHKFITTTVVLRGGKWVTEIAPTL